jgi:hypothetical protein
MLDDVAADLAVWIDDTANQLALAFAPGGVAPFAAQLTEDEKLTYYTSQLFKPDGSPNLPGRTQQMQRLGAEGFAQVYKAVTQAHPELRQAALAGAGPPPPAPPGPVGPPMPPVRPMASGGVVSQPTLALLGEAGPEVVVPLSDVTGGDYPGATGPHIPQELDFSFLDTQLPPEEEARFQQWKAAYAPNDSGWDYDLRGAYLAGLQPDPATGHWPDTFKKPNHPTFSDQSKFAADFPNLVGSWSGETYIPPPPPPQREPPEGWDRVAGDQRTGIPPDVLPPGGWSDIPGQEQAYADYVGNALPGGWYTRGTPIRYVPPQYRFRRA